MTNTMTNYKSIIIENRTNTKALKADAFTTKDQYTAWRDAVEALRLAVSDYAVANRTNADSDTIKECVSNVFEAYKIVLSVFTNKALGEKLGCHSTDAETFLTFIGTYRKPKDGEDGKQFLPVGALAFRKSIEDFIADRLTGADAITAADIEAEKKAKREAKKARRLAEKEALKALEASKKETKEKEEKTAA